MPDRPLTFPEKCAALAAMNDLESRLSTLRYMALETELEIERVRPGWSVDQMLGASKDRPVNAEQVAA